MIDLRFRPLPKWPGKLLNRTPHFRTPFDKTLDKLEYELKKIRAREILIEAGFTLEEIRNDGWPRGSARSRHPGVILYCKAPEGDLRFPCGTYNGWHDNMHAIALTLESLRAIDRYGVTLEHQQYMGFKAIAPPAPQMSVEEAAGVVAAIALYLHPAEIVKDAKVCQDVYRFAAKKCHPDTGAGVAQWHELQQAKAVLDEHHKTA